MTTSLPLLYILDADGTIRGCNVEGQPCPNAPGEQYLLPGAAEAIKALEADGHVWAIASNQGGVELGYTDPDQVNATFDELRDMLELEGCSQPPNALVFWCGSMDPTDPDRFPYAGGWPIGNCHADIVGTGNEVGDIAMDFALLDQFGEAVRLHDFCDRLVLLHAGAFW